MCDPISLQCFSIYDNKYKVIYILEYLSTWLSLADDESGDDDDYGTGSSDDDEQKRIKQWPGNH